MVNLAVSNKKEAVVRKETFFFFSINRIINVVIITTEEPPVKPSVYMHSFDLVVRLDVMSILVINIWHSDVKNVIRSRTRGS